MDGYLKVFHNRVGQQLVCCFTGQLLRFRRRTGFDFQFNELALKNLFCPELGFEILDSGLENPIVGRFSYDAKASKVGDPVYSLNVHSCVLARKVRAIDYSRWSWRECIQRIRSESSYPGNTP